MPLTLTMDDLRVVTRPSTPENHFCPVCDCRKSDDAAAANDVDEWCDAMDPSECRCHDEAI